MRKVPSKLHTDRQTKLFENDPNAYGGDLLKRHKARQKGRPLATRQSMHFVLRSSQAKGAWSFRHHKLQIRFIIEKFSKKFGLRLHSMANVGNHLHLHLQLTNRHTYSGFIRAVTASIMMQVTGVSRWNKIKLPKKFWDRRPFSRVILGFRAWLNLKDYIAINKLQGAGNSKAAARFYYAWGKAAANGSG